MIALLLTLALLGPALAQDCYNDTRLSQLQSVLDDCTDFRFADYTDTSTGVTNNCTITCTDTFYNNMVYNYQCALGDMYLPPSPGFESDGPSDFAGYADFVQDLADLSEACYFRNITLKGTQTLTEPPLPTPTPAVEIGRPRECAGVCYLVETWAEHNATKYAAQYCMDASGNMSDPNCQIFQLFCGPGAKNYAQLAQCFQCHIITVNSTGANYGLGDDNKTLDAIATGCSLIHEPVVSQPLYTTFPLPTSGATQGLVVATQSWNFTTSTHAVFTVPTASATVKGQGSGAERSGGLYWTTMGMVVVAVIVLM